MNLEFFKEIKEGMKDFGETISIIINSILLLIVYILGVGLTSIIAKFLFGKHFLETEILRERKSYWSNLNLTKKNQEEYYRQF